MMVKIISLMRAVLLWSLLVCSSAHPVDHLHGEDLTHEDGVIKGARNYEKTAHHLKMEHKEEDSLSSVVDKVLTPEATAAVDKMASTIVSAAGGVVDNLGDFVVETIDQLPEVIRGISDAVGKAVDTKREKVLIMVKGTHLEDDIQKAQEASDRITSAVEKSELQSSLQTLQDSFASLLGKFIGAAFKNADGVSSALTDGIRKITKSDVNATTGGLEILSRSNKENEILPSKNLA